MPKIQYTHILVKVKGTQLNIKNKGNFGELSYEPQERVVDFEIFI